METQNQQTSSLRSKLAIVGVSGVVFVGGTLGLSSLASAQTGTEPTSPSEPAAAVEDEHDDISFFDSMSDSDQALILEFEECLADAGLLEEFEDDVEFEDHEDVEDIEVVELTDEEYDAIEAAFEGCEPILDDLSFDADEWLGGGIDDDFEGCDLVDDEDDEAEHDEAEEDEAEESVTP